jgi:hypothetical protein
VNAVGAAPLGLAPRGAAGADDELRRVVRSLCALAYGRATPFRTTLSYPEPSRFRAEKGTGGDGHEAHQA